MPRLLLVAGAAVILIAMTGCVEPTPRVTVSPTPSATPVFASEEEALAAAEAAYREYLAVSDQILQAGGVDGDKISPYVTAEKLPDVIDGFQDFVDRQLHSEGTTTFDGMAIIQFDDSDIDAYVCLDVSQVHVLDASGRDVTVPDRDDRLPLELGFRLSNGSMLISRSDTWTGDDFC